MSQYKEKQVFESHLANQTKDKFSEKQIFDNQEFALRDLGETELGPPIEPEVEKLFQPKRSTWKWKLGLGAFAGLTAWQSFDTLNTAILESDYLGIAWLTLLLGAGAAGLKALLGEFFTLRRLRRQGDIQDESQRLYDQNDYGNGVAFCEKLTDTMGLGKQEHLGYQRWQEKQSAVHSDQDVLDLYQGYVLAPIDEKVKKAIAKYASEAAIMVAVSPLATVDMMLVAWRNIALVNHIAREYGVELGYWSRIRLLKMTLANMAAAAGSELALDVGADMLSMDLTAKLSARAAQGVGIGLLTARLGIKAAQLLRPIAFKEPHSLRLQDLRGRIVLSVKQRLQGVTGK